MKNKTIIYAPFSLWGINFATDLEIAQKCLDEGDTVYWISCHKELPICRSNRKRYPGRCLSCQYCRKLGIDWLKNDIVQQLSLNNITIAQQKEIESFVINMPHTLSGIKELELEGSDIGLAVVSSLVSHFRDPSPDTKKYRWLAKKYLQTALIVHFSLKNHIKAIQPDRIYLLNGRFAALRPVLRLAQKKKIPIFIHERAGVQKRYRLTPNNFTHSIGNVKRLIESHWHQSMDSEEGKKTISQSWFADRMKGKDQGWKSFVRMQKTGKLPKKINPAKINIGLFISSEDEFVSFQERQNPIYKDQNDGIEKILNAFQKNDSVYFYIRVHPNLSGLNNTQTKKLYSLASHYESVTILKPESDIDTYELVKAVNTVVTFGTTVGIEAAYLGKTPVLLGRAVYEDLGVAIKPKSHEEVVKIFANFNDYKNHIDPDTLKKGAEKFGYYQATYGIPFKYVNQVGVSNFNMTREGKTQSISLSKKRELLHFFQSFFK